MQKKNEGVKISLTIDERTYSVSGLPNDSYAGELQEAFDRLLFQAGYHSDVRCADGGSISVRYKEEWEDDDEKDEDK